MIFRTKRELLRYRGKNENDNKLVDRRIASGKVVKVADGYKVVDLEDEVKKLRSELENAKNVANTTQQGKNTLPDLKEHIEYLLMLNEKKNELIKSLTNIIYIKHQDKGRDYAVEYVAKQFGYEPDPSEEDELNFIRELLNSN